MPSGRRVTINNELKKKLTVSPFMPGAPVPVNFTFYKLTNKFMYIPKYFSDEGDIIENEITKSDIKINNEPRDYQIDVIKKIHSELKSKEGCIACLYTGWGKTFASIYIAHLMGLKTLVVVNKESLMEQWKEQIIKFTGITPGIIQGNKINVENEITIGMIQSISMKEYPIETFKSFSFTIFDEMHHYCSKVFSNAFYKIGSKYNLGLTATLKRADRLEHTLEWFLGRPAVNVQLLIIEPEIQIHKIYEYPETMVKYLPNSKVNCPATITGLTELTKRNEYIIDLIKTCYNCDRKILVLTDRKAHCDYLKEKLEGFSVGLYYGGMKRENLLMSNNCKIIIATYQMASEGYDNPALDTLILASPKTNVEQSVGRILRQKNLVVFFKYIP